MLDEKVSVYFSSLFVKAKKGRDYKIWIHKKRLFCPVSAGWPNPQYAVLLQEQSEGSNGE